MPEALPNPSQYEIGCHARRFHLLFRAANESWLSVSRKHTTFNTPPQWVGMMSNYDEIHLREQLSRNLMEVHLLVSPTITPVVPAIAMPLAAL